MKNLQNFPFSLQLVGILNVVFLANLTSADIRIFTDKDGILSDEPIPLVEEIVNFSKGKLVRDYSFCTVNRNPQLKNDSVPLGIEKVNLYGNVPALIANHGFDFVEHKVKTEDGYILTVFRLKFVGREPTGSENPPVFLQHGFSSSSAEWLMVDWPEALPYSLLRQGYDVWLGNSRGSEYSLDHADPLMSHQLPKYWDFSVHEIGKFDLPAVFDYILQKTSRKTLTYIGKGMGSTMFYACMSLRPELNSKIHLMISLSPVAYSNNTKSPIRILSTLQPLSKYLLQNGRLSNEIVTSAVRLALPTLCNLNYTVFNPCQSFISFAYGSNPFEYSVRIYRRVFGHWPSSTSVRTLAHSLQHIRNGRFDQYDFGMFENLRRYGTNQPPSYNLTRVDVPTLNLYGRYDSVAVVKDTRRTLSEISKRRGMNNFVIIPYNSNDFTWGRHVAYTVNTNIITFLEKMYRNSTK